MCRGFFNDSKSMVVRNTVPLGELVEKIKNVFFKLQDEMYSSGIKIKTVKLTLKTVATGELGAEAKFQIPVLEGLKMGSQISKETLQTTVLKFKPPEPQEPKKGISEISFEGMEEQLENSIQTIVDAVKVATNTQPPLELEGASTEFNFLLKSSSEISLILQTDLESELSNNVKIEFEKN